MQINVNEDWVYEQIENNIISAMNYSINRKFKHRDDDKASQREILSWVDDLATEVMHEIIKAFSPEQNADEQT